MEEERERESKRFCDDKYTRRKGKRKQASEVSLSLYYIIIWADMHSDCQQPRSLPITPSPWEHRLLGLCIHTQPIEATAAFNMHQIFKAYSVPETLRHPHARFLHSLQAMNVNIESTAGTSPSVAVWLPPLKQMGIVCLDWYRRWWII